MAYAPIQPVFAQIKEGVVQNRIICEHYELANYLTRCSYGEDAFAVSVDRYRVTDGDLYVSGGFFRVNQETGERTELPYLPSAEQEVDALKEAKAETQEYNMELDYRLSCLELGLSGK